MGGSRGAFTFILCIQQVSYFLVFLCIKYFKQTEKRLLTKVYPSSCWQARVSFQRGYNKCNVGETGHCTLSDRSVAPRHVTQVTLISIGSYVENTSQILVPSRG